jgi:hypothetical protein
VYCRRNIWLKIALTFTFSMLQLTSFDTGLLKGFQTILTNNGKHLVELLGDISAFEIEYGVTK